jgi:hypothetical protein
MVEKFLGDHVEDILHKMGVDKVAKKIEEVTKKPCGCQQRKETLNEMHKKLTGKE